MFRKELERHDVNCQCERYNYECSPVVIRKATEDEIERYKKFKKKKKGRNTYNDSNYNLYE